MFDIFGSFINNTNSTVNTFSALGNQQIKKGNNKGNQPTYILKTVYDLGAARFS